MSEPRDRIIGEEEGKGRQSVYYRKQSTYTFVARHVLKAGPDVLNPLVVPR